MPEERLPRKLAAILYADVAGYSRLTGEDEDGTHRMLRAYLALMAERIAEHAGRVVHYAGDAVLADFSTVVDALGCAVAVQTELAERNAEVPPARRVQFRIGVNLGDVIVDGDDIYGDGVNVAARLESLAEPGGVCVADAVRTAMGSKLGFRYEDMGERTVKNIAAAVRCFHVRFLPDDVPGFASGAPSSGTAPGAAPTVAIEAFRFIGDPGPHAYVADAITQSVGAALTHFREYRVVGKGESEAADYVLRGTLQIAGGRIRIAPELVSAGDGRKLWSEKLDRQLDDVFALQDEISAIVAAYLGEAIWQQAARALTGKRQSDYNAADWCMEAMACVHRLNREGFIEAKAACRSALRLDAESLHAKLLLAFTLALELGWGLADDPDECGSRVLALTEELLQKDPANPTVHRLAARLFPLLGRHAEALAHAERALALNPFDGDVLVVYALALLYEGRAQEAVAWAERALRFNPHPPAYYRQNLMQCQFFAGQREAALETMQRLEGGLMPQIRGTVVTLLHQAGRTEEAAKATADMIANGIVDVRSAAQLLACYRDREQVETILAALRRAGLPEVASRQ